MLAPPPALTWLASIALLLPTPPVAARDGGPWNWQLEAGTTLVSRSRTSGSDLRLAHAQALAASLHRRWTAWHLFVQGEANAWRDQRDDGSPDFAMALNLGAGVALDHAGGRLRTSLALGTSLLVVPTDIDHVPSAGVFVDLRPLGFVWPIRTGVRIGLVPLSLTVAMPVLTGIPLVSLQYRTTVSLEGDL